MGVGILGPLEVVAASGPVRIGGVRLRTLLIRLALDAGRTVTVDALSGALWPEREPADPANALQSLVSRLRQALPAGLVVRSVPGGYRLDVPPDQVDALRFERLARDGRRALDAGELETAARCLREALALWRGEALADVTDAPFATAPIVRLSELRLAATEQRIETELQLAAEPSALVAELEALVAAHPLRERLRVLLIRALLAAERRAEALAAYEDYRALVADELGADPGPELQQMHLAVLRGDRAPERGRPARRRGGVRAPLTSFVGRDRERTRIAKLLAEGRLVTLVGPGGAGKTRLATTYAIDIADDIAGGVWMVELAAVTDPADVPTAVIGALGLHADGLRERAATARDATSRLVEALSASDVLLVLDNCEHVIDAAAQLVDDLLGRCPRLRVLATSREPLGIIGEALCPVSPLDVPPQHVPVPRGLASAAVRLFADRAAAVRPDFAVTADNVGAVVEICRRLDGLPLAIELAAARLRSLSIRQIATGLDDRFRLLTGGRTAVARHQTLRTVAGWSWDLLDDDERRLAERLSVFPGTVTPDSAAHMCALDPPVAAPVLEVLSALVDKSLLQVDHDERYRMLETIREYGVERLAEAGVAAEVAAAHAAYFGRLAEAAEPHLVGPGQLPWIRRLSAEQDNLVAVLHHARDAGDAQTAVRLGAAVGLFWTIRGDHAEAASWLRLALEVPGEAPEEARAVTTAIYLFNAVLSGGLSYADDLPTLPRPSEHHLAAAFSAAALALATDDIVAGLAAIDPLLGHGEPWKRGMLWLLRSLLHGNGGDMHAMAADLTEAVTAFRETGERWGLATSLTYLASVRMILGDGGTAIRELEESVRLLRELDPDDDAALQRVWIADARRLEGDVEGARGELVELVSSSAGAASGPWIALARITLGHLARYDGELDEASRAYDAAEQDLVRAPFDTPLFRALLETARGHLAVSTDDLPAARRHLDAAFALAAGTVDMPLVATVAVAVAWLTARDGAPAVAAELLGAAHALRGAPDAFNPDVATLVRRLRGEMDDRAYTAAYARGRAFDRRGALAAISARLAAR